MTVGATKRLGGVDLAADGDRAAAVGEQPWRRLEVAVVDDAAEVVAGLAGRRRRSCAICRGELVDEASFTVVVDEHVVGGDAGLAGVEELAPRDAAGRDVEVGVGGDDGRATCRRARGPSGVRCLAAASAMTTRPTAVEPVKKMWSKRWSSSAVVSATPPSTTMTALVVDVAREEAGEHGRARRGQLARAWRRTQLPAASAAASGSTSSWIG